MACGKTASSKKTLEREPMMLPHPATFKSPEAFNFSLLVHMLVVIVFVAYVGGCSKSFIPV